MKLFEITLMDRKTNKECYWTLQAKDECEAYQFALVQFNNHTLKYPRYEVMWAEEITPVPSTISYKTQHKGETSK